MTPKISRAKLALGLLAALLAGPAVAGATTGGGSVENVLPTITALSVVVVDGGGCSSSAFGDRGGDDAFLITGVVEDANGEDDVSGLRLNVTGADSGSYTISNSNSRWDVDTSPADVTPDTDPDAASADWVGSDRINVWDDSGSSTDGRFRFNLLHPISTTDDVGTVVFTAAAKDEAGLYNTGPAPDAIATIGRVEVTVDLDPVLANGTSATARWGDWSAPPGALNVEAANYLRVRNTGDCAAPHVLLSWDDGNLTGYGKPTEKIPLLGNLDYLSAQAPAGTPPAQASFAATAAGPSPDGAGEFAFAGTSQVLYLGYRLRSLPTVLEDLTYRQSLTLNCVTDGCDTVYV